MWYILLSSSITSHADQNYFSRLRLPISCRTGRPSPSKKLLLLFLEHSTKTYLIRGNAEVLIRFGIHVI